MSTIANIRSAWNTKIWTNATITDLTTKIYNYDLVSKVESRTLAKDTKLFYEQQRINFFQYLVSREQEILLVGAIRHVFTVEVQYYLEADSTVTDANYNVLHDRLETLDTLVRTSLTKTWNDTVDVYTAQSGAPSIQILELDSRQVWRGDYSYFGTENTII